MGIVNVGKGSIVRVDGKVIGRIVPKRDALERWTYMFIGSDGKVCCRQYGRGEIDLRIQLQKWEVSNSYLAVEKCILWGTNVFVTLVHNSEKSMDLTIQVPFGLDWQKEVTAKLKELSLTTNSETHIANYGDLCV